MMISRPSLKASRNPDAGLLEIGEHVAVTEHRALRDARGAAGVLQEGKVIGRRQPAQRRRGTAGERVKQGMAASIRQSGNHLPDVLTTKFTSQRSGSAAGRRSAS
jgi:hypothetical protein